MAQLAAWGARVTAHHCERAFALRAVLEQRQRRRASRQWARDSASRWALLYRCPETRWVTRPFQHCAGRTYVSVGLGERLVNV